MPKEDTGLLESVAVIMESPETSQLTVEQSRQLAEKQRLVSEVAPTKTVVTSPLLGELSMQLVHILGPVLAVVTEGINVLTASPCPEDL
jgi:ethanolamine utilization microcompartment shell protein EutS